MFSTVIFDFGNVLATWDPNTLAKGFGLTEAEEAEVYRVFFSRERWERLDSGAMDIDDYAAAFAPELPPELREIGTHIFCSWPQRLPPIPGMEALVTELKKRGVGCYLLSNICKNFGRWAGHYPVLAQMDGTVFSGDIRHTKPGAAIFEHLLSRYGLERSSCLFIDDMQRNIDGAAAVGIAGYRFDGDVPRLREYLAAHTVRK